MQKRILSLALVVCLLVAVLPLSASAEMAADTSWYDNYETDDVFYISTAEQLYALTLTGVFPTYLSFEGKTICITADIDMSGYNWPGTYTSLTNYAFRGTLDGQNHVISNLTGKPFFGSVVSGATLKNICISNAVISGGTILATQVAAGGVVDSCIVSGTATGGNNAAAISGLTNGTVTNCIAMCTIIANTNSGAGGLIYNSTSDSAVVTNNAVFNYLVQGMRPASAGVIGRVVGFTPRGTVSGNLAYDGMSVLDQTGTAIEVDSDSSGKHGESISLAEIYASGILNRLPANFPIPEYLAQPEDPEVNILNVRPGAPVARDVLGTANFTFEGLLQKRNVNLIEAEFTYDASSFTIEAVSAMNGLTVERINVYGADNKVVVVLGVAGTEGAFVPDELASLVNFTMRAAWGEQPESATLTLESATLYAKGEIVEYNVLESSATVALNYRAPLDVNGDGVIDAADLSIVLYYFGFSSTDTDWDEAASSDVNDDGTVDMIDITLLVEAIYG